MRPQVSRRAARQSSRARRVRRCRPGLECLESLLLLSTNVLSYHNDVASTGQNLDETQLTPANVNASDFGKLFQVQVDGQVYAQPLVDTGVNITTGDNQGIHDVVFVATEHDSLYAIDASSPNGVILWQTSFLNSGLPGATSITPVPATDVSGDSGVLPEIGITGTPVIDSSTNTLYVVATTKEIVSGVAHYVERLHAINLSDGTDSIAPLLLGDTVYNGATNSYTINTSIYVYGSGAGSVTDPYNGTGEQVVQFNAMRQLQRPGLTLSNGMLYLAFGSNGDVNPAHGWLVGVDPVSLAIVGVLNTTPNGNLGSIWQSGDRVASDGTYLYFETGNGTFDGQNGTSGNTAPAPGPVTGLDANGFPVDGDYGDSFVKVAVDPTSTPTQQNIDGWGLKVVDYFTPFDQEYLQSDLDLDLGSGGPLILPDSVGSTAHPNLLVGGGKEGIIYLVDRDNMGKFGTTNNVVQEVNAQAPIYDTPAYYNNTIYYVPISGAAEAYSISNGQMSTAPTSTSPDVFGYPGSTPSISANGSTDGIVWDVDRGTDELRAYNSDSYATELYNSDQAGNRDSLGPAVKFGVVTVANGYVYVGTSSTNPNNDLVVYGEVPLPATAALVGRDAVTQGNWIGTYGSQGYNVIGNAASYPAYATVTPAGQSTYTWAVSTTDPRALETAGGTGRVAAGWYSTTSFTVDVDLPDRQVHDLALYAVDWDGNNQRSEQIQLISAATGLVLDTETISSFSGGVYLVWKVTGDVVVQVTCLAGQNAVLSGLFIDPPPATAALIGQDTGTQGNWIGTYGFQGYNVIGNAASYPAYATVTAAGQSTYTWAASTTDPRALETVGGTGRIAACWYSTTSFTVNVDLADGAAHDLALYAVDWDGNDQRSEQIQLISAATGLVLDTETISSFSGGVYLDWKVTGDVVVQVTLLAGQNAVLSGLFIDPPPATAVLIGQDAGTQGNWIGTYGSQGYNVIGNTASYPVYATVTPAGQSTFTWAASTTDPRALETAGGTGRIAACWYSATSFTVDVDLSDGAMHDLALYALDWDSNNQRSEQIQLISAATGLVLDTETISSFSGGVYLVWKVTGDVVVQVTCLAGQNAVLSGLFIDPPPATATLIGRDTGTQGNWIGTYGSQGYNIIGNATSYPAYATVTPAGQSTYTWAASTTDPRALETAGGTGRIAACWYSTTSFTVNVDLADGAAHDLVLYAVDWDGNNQRSEQIQLLSGATVLDTETISSFSGGVYLDWKVTGDVVVQVTCLAGVNAVLSGLFIDPPPATAALIGQDAVTQGNWIGTYGSQGYNIIGNAASYPAYATVTPAGQSTYTWAASTTDPRALETAGGTGRVAACWYSTTSFTVDVDLTDGAVHDLALYAVDWDGNNQRSEQIQLISAVTGLVLDTETISSFSGGVYLDWKVTGDVVVQVTCLAGVNAVLSGLFIDPPPATAALIGQDAGTQGNWIGTYGSQGYNVIGNAFNYPAYATVTPAGQSTYIWAASTTDPRALETAGGTGRIAACWLSATSFTVDVNLADGAAHDLALYAVDWDDNNQRSEEIQLISAATGLVLDTETISSFSGGVYLVWKVTGNVVVQVTCLAGTNAVLSGLFIDPPSAT
jgi:hypothetical protein